MVTKRSKSRARTTFTRASDVGGGPQNGGMTVVDWDALPVADPLLSERPMLRGLIESLVDSEAQIGAIRARQAMLFTAITEVVELQTSRLPDAARFPCVRRCQSWRRVYG